MQINTGCQKKSGRSSSLVEGRLDRLVGGVARLVHEHVVGEAVVLPQGRLHVLLLHLLLLASSVGAGAVALRPAELFVNTKYIIQNTKYKMLKKKDKI